MEIPKIIRKKGEKSSWHLWKGCVKTDSKITGVCGIVDKNTQDGYKAGNTTTIDDKMEKNKFQRQS